MNIIIPTLERTIKSIDELTTNTAIIPAIIQFNEYCQELEQYALFKIAHNVIQGATLVLLHSETLEVSYKYKAPRTVTVPISTDNNAKSLKMIDKYKATTNYYELLEQTQKNLYRDLQPMKIRTQLPFKLWLEVQGENEYFKDLEQINTILKPIKKPKTEKELQELNRYNLNAIEELTEKELLFLYKYAPIYNVEIPKVYTMTPYVKTQYGYAMHQQLIYNRPLDHNDTLQTNFYEDGENAPKYIRELARPKPMENKATLIDCYNQLKYLMSFGEEFKNPDYKTCPICNEYYNINKGCSTWDNQTGKEQTHVHPIHLEFLSYKI